MQVVAEHINRILPVALTGSVSKIVGLTVSVVGFPAPLGSTCCIHHGNGKPIQADVIGFHGDETLLLPYSQLVGVRRGNRVTLTRSVPGVRVGDRLLGRVINGHGRCLDGQPDPTLPHRVDLNPDPVSPLNRPPIDSPLGTGIRAIDGFLTCGMGQRLGIFSASGVGKSTLLGQMARYSSADVNVVVLVGERGREVREFIERELGPDGLARSVVVVATSDEPALLRLRAAYLGTAVAEYFRDQGRNVLMMMDSVTRVALAMREIGLAAGEPPATRGYPPSVFAALPRLLERSGRTERGSITGLYTVLVEADDPNEPVSDAVRGILDGHILLSRRLAEQAHWPAIDVLASISRSMNSVVSEEHRSSADEIKRLLAAYDRSADLIDIGAYQAGSNPTVDTAIRMKDDLDGFLRQASNEHVAFDDVRNQLQQLNESRSAFQPVAAAGAGHKVGADHGAGEATAVAE